MMMEGRTSAEASSALSFDEAMLEESPGQLRDEGGQRSSQKILE
jgi:hypothetical protein